MRGGGIRIAQLRMSPEERQLSDLMKAVILTASILVMITVIVALGVFVGLIPWILAQLKRSSANSYPVRGDHPLHKTTTQRPLQFYESSSSTSTLTTPTTSFSSSTSTSTTTPTTPSTSTSMFPPFWLSTSTTTTTITTETPTSTITLLDVLKLSSTTTITPENFSTTFEMPNTTTLLTTIAENTSTVDYFALEPFEAILNGTNIELGLDLDVWLNTTSAPIECVPNPNSAVYLEPLFKSNMSRICRNSSIYVPQPLTIMNAYYFGYPILQTISCYGSKLELRCPKNQHLHVFAAYYGNQMNTNYCNDDLDVICFRSASYDYLLETCENQTFCNLLVTERVFGNPCLDLVSNQIMVQYQCVDADAYQIFDECPLRTEIPSNCPPLTQPEKQFEKYWCEPDTMQIECEDESTVISILCAFYGIDPNIKCSSPSSGLNSTELPTACFSQSSQTRVSSECNGKRECSFPGEISFEIDSGFVNPCPGYQNMLYVQWECVSAANMSSMLIDSQDEMMMGMLADELMMGLSTIPAPTTRPNFLNTTQRPVYCEDEQEDMSEWMEQCAPHSFSPYEPKFPTQTSQVYFHYALQQQLVCQGSRLMLVCPSPLVIHIHAAYYGIQSATRSSTCTTSSYEIPAKCYLPRTFDIINSTCERKTSCQLRAASSTLADNIDFCPAYQKQLLIQYMCVHEHDHLLRAIDQCPINWVVPPICAPVNETRSMIAWFKDHEGNLGSMVSFSSRSLIDLLIDQEQQTWCDGASVSIECPNSRIIEIVCAFYGIHPEIKECGIPSMEHKPVCYFASSSSILSSMCDNQSTCNIDTALTFNRDPCVGHTKALFIQWRCI